MSSAMGRRGHPASSRLCVSVQLLTPLTASTVSTLHAPTAQADASVAWCAGQAAGSALIAVDLERGAAEEIFGDRRAVLARGPGEGTVVTVEGGFRLSGRWSFASGCHHAKWLGAHMPVAGTGKVRTMLFPKSSVQMTTSGTPSACAAPRATNT